MSGWVTTSQLGERLGVSPKTVIYHINRGHIEAERPGGRDFLITEEEAARVVALYQPHKHRTWRGLEPLRRKPRGTGDAGQHQS
jgi:excisionase family DNA binding protein